MDCSNLQEFVLPDPLRGFENLRSTTEPETVGKFN